ncbi:YheC/YheD family protein [Polycladomyces subterraneus]|uniref:YheC/YheD family protein n=1 Tax=Polycladomyces subterraneus TaxID=1016997 RepID=A0ABT8IMZ5_9BACL|nr:YheC/YheD family protein [Polycladomyces subterraneus]MDN4594156.1 YheC/YheD family protein [Polycladomyces subterraneus]
MSQWWNKLKGNVKTAPHIPQTEPLSSAALQDMLQKHSFIYIKPANNIKGKHTFRVDALGSGEFLVYDGKKNIPCPTYEDLIENLHPIMDQKKRKHYIIQQGIWSLTRDQRHFVIRVHLKQDKNVWRVTSIKSHTSNKKGHWTKKSVSFNNLMKDDLKWDKKTRGLMKLYINQKSYAIASVISNKSPRKGMRIDLGIEKGHLWVFKVT